MRRPFSLSAFAVLLSLLPAQNAPTAATETTATEAMPGRIAGTRRFNVTFRDRSFDLAEFRAAVRSHQPASVVDRIVASLQARAEQETADFRTEVRALGGDVVITFWLINAVTIEIDPKHVAQLEKLANVAYIHPDLPTEPLRMIKTATAANNHNADYVQNTLGITGAGVGVGIIDTGQDSNMGTSGRPHMIYYRNNDTSQTKDGGIGGSLLHANKQLAAQPPDDPHNHGTGVAGIATGNSWNNAAGDRGHAYDAVKIGYSICQSAGSCGSSLAIEALGFQTAAADKVQFNIASANMSYSSTPNPLDVSQQAIDACALNADLLPVTAAANSSSSTTGSSSTANGLAVAAVAPTSKAVASFSSRGPLSGDTQRFFPDISACGVSTIMPLRNNEASNYTGSGTSMASPQVAGAAALIQAARPGASASEVKAILLCNTEDISAQNPSPPYNTRNAYGMGFLRDDLAVGNALVPARTLSGAISSTTTPRTHQILVTANQKVSVALVWHRHVLTSTAWSNLGLRVLSGTTVIAQNNDPRNLYEVVRFTAPSSTVLTVEVSASSLEVASVPYSLASTNDFVGAASSYQNYGTACAGQLGRPSLTVSQAPQIGEPWTIGVAFARPSSTATVLFGVSDTNWLSIPLPLDLTVFNAKGCWLLASAENALPIPTDAKGTGALNLNVPNLATLIGAKFFNQIVVADSGANGLNATFSQGGAGVIGQF